VLERLGEALFLLLEDLRNARLRLRELGIRRAHRPVEILDQAVEKRLLLAEVVAVADRAPHDPAQHVAATLVAGDHAIDDEKAAGADMVRDDV
jgi:hypothetical protein